MAEVQIANYHLAVDPDEAVADLDDDATTASVRSSILESRQEHGRTYHGYKDGEKLYHRPNDEHELNRLDIANEMFLVINDGKLHLAPINTAGRVLDLGAGTGIWCIEMGDAYPTAEVIGVDLSASMPNFLPPNVRFEIDDIEDDWTYSRPFDFIHSRYMIGGIKDWPRLFEQSYESLKPGGWIEFVDFHYNQYSQDGTLTDQHAMRRWLANNTKAMTKLGRILDVGTHLAEWATAAGFINVNVVKTIVPIGSWPKDKELKRMGLLNWIQLYECLEGVSLRLYLNVLGWTREEVEVLLMEVRQDFKDRSIHMMYDLYTVWAQKPE